jgi:putative membrane-bound dehydrogenase-like protein
VIKCCALLIICAVAPVFSSSAQSSSADFRRLRLSETFYSEGATFGDIDADGVQDIVSGPFWYAGPEFSSAHEFMPVVEADPLAYSDDFFAFVLDLDGDGLNDIFKIGFPGKAATWYRNPGHSEDHWTAHVVFNGVDNESPILTDIDSDGKPELVCCHGGAFGFARANWEAPDEPWQFQAVSPALKKGRFTHGLGVGDVNSDGRLDLIESDGWWEQPVNLQEGVLWEQHAHAFTTKGGGAQIFVYDIDGDGDSDVISSLWAHGWGLSWFEQVPATNGDDTDFIEHLLMDGTRETNPWGVRFSAIHALQVADMDGDGLLDLVTGKRHWSHGPDGDPIPGLPSVVYWFRLERRADGVRFVPHLIDDDSGVGTQVVVGDVNGDGRPDVVVGNKQGTFVLMQGESISVDEPPLYLPDPPAPSPNEREGILPKDSSGGDLNMGFESGDLTDWTTSGDAFEGQPVRGDKTAQRGLDSSDHVGEYWVGGYEIHGDARVGVLTSVEFEVTHPWASFLVGGGRDFSTRVVIESAAGDVIFSSSGPNTEPLLVAVVDLRAHQGEMIRILIVDEQPGGWGHINYDDFLFHAEKPVIDSSQLMLVADDTKFSGQTALEAAAAMSVPAGFHVDLIAAEPDLYQPIALAIDDRGRVWVAEAHSYPVRVADEDAKDMIVVFEDADNDGSFETRTVFADDLNLISGLEVGLGGVWVGAAPNLMFIPDRDHDLVPDGPPEILLDGWAYQDTHETLNAFTWGPDGWLYGCHGVFTYSEVGVPGTPDNEREPINCGVWRYHPTKKTFEVFSWGTSNPWGLDFDDQGQAFITACVIPHLFHMVQGGRYVRQAGSHYNKHAFLEIETIADHLHYLGSTPWVGNNVSSSAGGGHAHAGAMIYLGNSFPDEYRGRIFMNNIHGNRINSDSFVPDGSGFIGHHEEDLLNANDTWFRGINMKYGPDGSVFFIDWSDERACHSATPEIWERSNGRLFRLRYGDLAPKAASLDTRADEELAWLQQSTNEYLVRRARLELQGRDNPVVRKELTQQLAADVPVAHRLRALWTLHACGQLEEAELLRLLESEEEYLAAWAVQLLCEDKDPTAAARMALTQLAKNNPSPVVGLYLASALQRIAPDFELAEALLSRTVDKDDKNIPTVLWYGLEAHVGIDADRAVLLAKGAELEESGRLIVRRAAAEAATRDALFHQLFSSEDNTWRDLILEELDDALRDARHLAMPELWSYLYPRFAADSDEGVRDRALWISAAFDDRTVLPKLTEILLDKSQPEDRRLRALDSVAVSSAAKSSAALRAVLVEDALRGAAIRGLAFSDDPATPQALLAIYPDLSTEERDLVLSTLSGRDSYALALMGAVENGSVPSEDLSQFVLRKLRALGSTAVDEASVRVWGVFRESDEDLTARIAEWAEEYAVNNNAIVRPSHGRDVFDRTCAKCHTLFAEGGSLGPDITGSNRADAEYIWTNILDPNAIIGRDYQVTMVRTYDGLLVTGVLKSETESSITLATETEDIVVAIDDIEERILSDISVMPEGQADSMTQRERRDLIAYLGCVEQVRALSSELESNAFFNGTDLVGWSGDEDVWGVEEGAIVGKTGGHAKNAFLLSDHEIGEFRLSFDVLLKDNTGNSGVQFWSRQIEGGDVTGYQADIGLGWWGKLYEEHGRALLWSESDESIIKAGDWNQYIIEATEERVRTWINGTICVDLEDPEGAFSGRIALQVHSGDAIDVRFKNLRLELLGGK